MEFLKKNIKRRNLLKLLWVAPFALLYNYLTPKVKKDKVITIPVKSIPYDSVYLIKDKQIGILNRENGITVLSIACTHLGCILNVENDKFICPCHGSMFELNGSVIKGPALKPLKHIKYTIENNNIIINL